MAALQTAVALVEVDHVAEVVSQNLDLDVAWFEHRLLEIDGGVPECGLSLPAGGFDRFGQRCDIADAAHPTAAAAGNRLDEQRKPHVGGRQHQLVHRG